MHTSLLTREIYRRKAELWLIEENQIKRPRFRRGQLRREIKYWERRLQEYKEDKLIDSLTDSYLIEVDKP